MNETTPSYGKASFSSPKAEYPECGFDLNEILVKNKSSTFFIRVKNQGTKDLGIFPEDILVVDRSLLPRQRALILSIMHGEFKVTRFNKKVFELSEHEIWGTITHVIHSFK